MAVSVFGQMVDHHIKSTRELRNFAEVPGDNVKSKVIDHIDPLSKRFIKASSLAILGTVRADGMVDLTPRGDPAGFVNVLDEKTIAVPDRPGNNRMDALENVIATGSAGLIFIIPGHRVTLRVSGKAKLVKDESLGQMLAVNNRPAGLVLLIQVEHVLSHCPKAFVRGQVWQPDKWPDTSNVPTQAEMMLAHADVTETLSEMEEIIRNDCENRLY